MKKMLYKLRNWPSTTIIRYAYDLQKKVYRFRKKQSLILIAAFPRSACNYLSYLVSESTGYAQSNLKPAFGFFHDVVYLPKLVDIMLRKRVVTQHLRATSMSRTIIQELNIRPIVLVRDIFDVVVSYNDFITKSGYGPLDTAQKGLAPESCNEYPHFEESKKFDYLIDTVVPWYISFYVSWYYYTIRYQEIEALWIKYEDFVPRAKAILTEIFSFYHLSLPESRVESILAQNKKVNFNKGISGRGTRLSIAQKDKIRSLAAYHSGIDFSMIGL